MKKVRVFLGLIILSFILMSLNVNSAFVLKDSSELINAYNNNNLIRLHVIANNNSPRDQFIKRNVRDAVVKYLGSYPEEKLKRGFSQSDLDKIKLFIEGLLKEEGVAYPVEVEFGKYDFPKRTYGDMTLPAGEYTSLKIVLGNGQGSNWWCVLLPPLCIEEDTNNELAFGKKEIEFRFKLAELFEIEKMNDIKLVKFVDEKLNLFKINNNGVGVFR